MSKPWFTAKRYGVGLSPCSWEGWLVTAAFAAAMVSAAVWLKRFGGGGAAIGALIAAFAVFLAVAALKSDHKPWRWRWGNDDP